MIHNFLSTYFINFYKNLILISTKQVLNDELDLFIYFFKPLGTIFIHTVIKRYTSIEGDIAYNKKINKHRRMILDIAYNKCI